MAEYVCPNCLSDRIISGFNVAHCYSCGLYWHYWKDAAAIRAEADEYLKGRAEAS